jgi:LPXTG-motif cell wall-anchored protein
MRLKTLLMVFVCVLAGLGVVGVAKPASAAGGLFEVTITSTSPAVLAGADATYTIGYTCSAGDSTATCDAPSIVVGTICSHPSGPVPACNGGLMFGPNADVVATSFNTASLRTLLAGEAGTLTLTVRTVNLSTPDDTQLVASISGNVNGAAYGPIAATAVNIDATLRFAADKQVTPATPAVGGTATYTIRYSSSDVVYGGVQNGTIGINPATARVVDTLPVGSELVSADSGGVYDSVARTVTWTPAPIFGSTFSGQAQVTVRFPVGTFSAGASVTNTAVVTGTPYGSTTAVDVPVSRTHLLSAPVYGRILNKQVYSSMSRSQTGQFDGIAPRGDEGLWNPTVQNTSNVPVDVSLSDVLQPGATAKRFTWQGNRLVLTYADATSETFTSNDPTAQKNRTIDPSKTVVSWDAQWDAMPPQAALSVFFYGPLGLPDLTTVRNCADTTGTVDGVTVWTTIGNPAQQACTGMTILAPRPIPTVNMFTSNPNSSALSTETGWAANLFNSSPLSGDAAIDALDTITKPWAQFTLSAGHSYVPGSFNCETVAPLCIVSVSTSAAGTEVIELRFPGTDLPPGSGAASRISLSFRTYIAPDAGPQLRVDVLFGDLDHPFVVANPCCEYPNRLSHVPDTADANANGVANEFLATAPAGRVVQVSGTVAGAKRVQGDRDSALVVSPGIGHAAPGGTAEFTLRIVNTGTQPAANVVAYDILPDVGDTGVLGTLASTPRGSQYPTSLRAAVTSPAAGAQIAYSSSATPCRPELGVSTSCVDDWSTATPADWSTVRAVRVRFVGTTLATGQAVTATVPVSVPADVALGQLAYNSFAYAVTVNAAPLATEPVRIGLLADGSDIALEKFVQTDFDADDLATAPSVLVGQPVRFTYTVTNSGTTTLTDVTVTDDRLDPSSIDCGDGTNVVAALAPTATATCTAEGTAEAGAQTNIGTATASSIDGTVDADDRATYVGVSPAIGVVKRINGITAPDGSAPPTITIGDPITFTYTVTNTGDVALDDLDVHDDVLGDISCPQTTLGLGESIVCSAADVAQNGAHRNEVTASATSQVSVYAADGSNTTVNVQAIDTANYVGEDPTPVTEPTTTVTPTTAPTTDPVTPSTAPIGEVLPPVPSTQAPQVTPPSVPEVAGTLPTTGSSALAQVAPLGAIVLLLGLAGIGAARRRRSSH